MSISLYMKIHLIYQLNFLKITIINKYIWFTYQGGLNFKNSSTFFSFLLLHETILLYYILKCCVCSIDQKDSLLYLFHV
jgi:hypothetical protein